MAWTIDFERAAERELDKLDPAVTRRILTFLHRRLSPLDDPRALGEALTGPELGEFWKYRVGDYRILARIQDRQVRILVVRIGNRREVYRRR